MWLKKFNGYAQQRGDGSWNLIRKENATPIGGKGRWVMRFGWRPDGSSLANSSFKTLKAAMNVMNLDWAKEYQ